MLAVLYGDDDIHNKILYEYIIIIYAYISIALCTKHAYALSGGNN